MSAIAHPLPPAFEAWLKALLEQRGLNPSEPRALAHQIMKLSDFYLENPGRHTPWEESYATEAYLSYFLPLNLMRLKAAWREVRRFLPDHEWSELWDFGSGLGTTQWMLETELETQPRRLYAIERAEAAKALYRTCAATHTSPWNFEFRTKAEPKPAALAVFSYAFLEMQDQLPQLEKFDHLLIVEPSTRDCGRALMEWRAKLMQMGFNPLAPCTHNAACPLLTQSARDWCHTRFHFAAPEWWQNLESHLPMHNHTLTYSYLLMSRTQTAAPTSTNRARVVGDTLHENGKSKQMICRGPNREFVSWLHRHGTPPEIPHGSIVEGLSGTETKGQELRAKPDTLSWS